MLRNCSKDVPSVLVPPYPILLLHNLEGTIVSSDQPAIQDSVYICDGNAILQAMTGIPETFEDVAEKIFGILPKTKHFDFVTDTYHPNSIKSFQRRHRGSSPTFLLSGPKTRTPRDWKSFMSNDENKTQLIKLLLSEWQKSRYAGKLRGRQLFFVCGEKCYCLTSYDGVEVEIMPQEDLFSSQEEADTRMILHCNHMAHSCPETSVIIVRSPDTDVLVLLVKFSQIIDQDVLFDTGMGNKRRLLNVKNIISEKGPELCNVLPALHSFTGCDTTSSFVRRERLARSRFLRNSLNLFAHLRVWERVLMFRNLPSNNLKSLFVTCMENLNTQVLINYAMQCSHRSSNQSQDICCQAVMEWTSAYYHLVMIPFECILSEQITKLIYGIIPKFVIQRFQVLMVMDGY